MDKEQTSKGYKDCPTEPKSKPQPFPTLLQTTANPLTLICRTLLLSLNRFIHSFV